MDSFTYVLAAWIYVRISEDKKKGTEKEGATVARQERECKAWMKERGIEVLGVITDNSVSATRSTYRKGFEQLLKKNPPAVVVWHQDRLVRVTKDLERVIALEVPVYSVKGGVLDLSTPQGRAVARTVTAWSTYEGEQRDVRQKSAQDEFHLAGEPVPGKRRFGYLGAAKGRRVNMKAHPAEAPIVRAMFESVGHEDVTQRRSINSWADELGWRRTRVRETLSNAAYMGVLSRAGKSYEASQDVDRIVTKEQFEKTRAALRSHMHSGRPGGVIKHMASGIARCGECGGTLSYRNAYLCMSDLSHPTVKGEYVDKKILSGIVSALLDTMTDEANITTSQLTKIEARLSDIDAEEAEWAEAKAAGMRFALIAPHLAALQEERQRLQDERLGIQTTSTRARVLSSLRASLRDPATHRVDMNAAVEIRREVERRFMELNIEERRELIALHLDIVVHPGRGPARVIVTERHQTEDDFV